MRFVFQLILFTILSICTYAAETPYLASNARKNDNIEDLLSRYEIDVNNKNINVFKKINGSIRLPKSGKLIPGKMYFLPIHVVQYAGEQLTALLLLKSEGDAALIEQYNDRMKMKGVRKDDFRISGKLWVPLSFSSKGTANTESKKRSYHRIFGKGYNVVEKIDNTLQGQVFYIDPGHGGPDPGAIGKRGKHELHEDEYAYDVSLRLARNLLMHGATVYIIVQEMKDGIRDERFLKNSNREKYYGGQSISRGHRERLEDRAAIINKLYEKHAATATAQHSVTIHVDSRTTKERIDIFFYHAPSSDKGKNIAETLLNTLREKYEKAQPGRGYNGNVEERDLFMLTNIKPIGTYIELGNIKNPNDQVRIIEPRNRQVIADWLCAGFLDLQQKVK